MNPEKIWNIIKKVKYEKSVDLNNIYEAVASVEQKMEVESSYVIFENMTASNLKIAAEIYLFLSTPSRDDEFLSWIVFYKNLIQTENLNQILLSLNRLMKETRLTENKFKSSTCVLAAHTHHYEK